MFCKKCGKEFADGAGFCPNCGTPVGVAPVNAAPAARAASPIAKLNCGRWFSLAMSAIFFLQFFLCLMPMHTLKGDDGGTYFRTTDIADSAVLTVFAALLSAAAFLGCFYLFLKEYTKVRVNALESVKPDYLIVPAVISTIYNFVYIFVSNGKFLKEFNLDHSAVRENYRDNDVYFGFSFGGIMMLILTCVATLLIIYKLYDAYSKKQPAARQY